MQGKTEAIMISQVPRQLEFGNPAHIARVDEWQALNDAEREMLLEVDFVITAYDLRGKPLAAYKRRQRR